MSLVYNKVQLKDTGKQYDNTCYNDIKILNHETTKDYIEVKIKNITLVLHITNNGTIELFTRGKHQFEIEDIYSYDFKVI